MIRINLATAGTFSPASATPEAGEMAVFTRDELIKAVASRVFFLMLFPAIIYAYELFNLPKLKVVVEQKQATLSELTEKNAKAPAILEELKKLDASEQFIRAKLDLVEGLKKTQLSEVRGLDTIQRSIPSRVWLTSLDMKDRKVRLVGFAQLDSDLGVFIDALAKSLFIKDVNLVKSTESNDAKSGLSFKQFELTAVLEVIK